MTKEDKMIKLLWFNLVNRFYEWLDKTKPVQMSYEWRSNANIDR